jgi:hypothetical protein
LSRVTNLRVLHFAGPVPDPAGLIEWVAARREIGLGETAVDTAELCQRVPGLRRPAPRTLGTVRL